jgi:hypothetical protein
LCCRPAMASLPIMVAHHAREARPV